MSLTLPIQAGKTYVLRDGTTTTVARMREEDFMFIDSHPVYVDGYAETGRRSAVGPCGADIVADFVESVVETRQEAGATS